MHKELAALVSAALLGSAAHAGMITHSGSLPLATTNWSAPIDVPQFDTLGGTRTLDMVSWTLDGEVRGSAQAESMDAAPSTIILTLSSRIEMFLGATLLDMVLPVADESFDASAFDGSIDFDGTSGVSFGPMSAFDSAANSTTIGLAPFIGNGVVSLTGVATGESSGSGAGNLITQFSATAGMSWSITYHFTVIPAPGAAMALGGLPLLAAGSRRRRTGHRTE